MKNKLFGKPLALLLGASLASISLSGCVTGAETAYVGPTSLRNPIKVAESIERLELYTRPNGLELSARDKLAVAQFLDNYAKRGSGPLFMNRPSNAVRGLGTQQAEATIRQLMAEGGINPTSLQGGEYQVTPGLPAPVVVSYRALQAIPADCSSLDDLAHTQLNQPYSSFGCFQSANLAAMITDPRQLLEPYAQGTPNAQRRQVIYDKYIGGETTGATRNGDQRANTQTSGG